MAINIIRPRLGRTWNALAIATPSKNVWSSNPISADGPAAGLTAWVSSPKWKCGVSVCWVRWTARYPEHQRGGQRARAREGFGKHFHEPHRKHEPRPERERVLDHRELARRPSR